MNIEVTAGEVRVHACIKLTAKKGSLSDIYWVSVRNQRGEEVTFFFTTESSAEAYEKAINGVLV